MEPSSRLRALSIVGRFASEKEGRLFVFATGAGLEVESFETAVELDGKLTATGYGVPDRSRGSSVADLSSPHSLQWSPSSSLLISTLLACSSEES